MEETKALFLMANLMRAQYRAHRAIIRASRARAPEQENMQLRYLGTSLVVMGTINAAVAYHAFINPNPTCVHVIFSIVQGFMIVSGITAMSIGWLLFVKDNPRKTPPSYKGDHVANPVCICFRLGNPTLAMIFFDCFVICRV